MWLNQWETKWSDITFVLRLTVVNNELSSSFMLRVLRWFFFIVLAVLSVFSFLSKIFTICFNEREELFTFFEEQRDCDKKKLLSIPSAISTMTKTLYLWTRHLKEKEKEMFFSIMIKSSLMTKVCMRLDAVFAWNSFSHRSLSFSLDMNTQHD